MKLLRIVGLSDGRRTEVDGGYVVSCDVDAREGRGVVEATSDPRRARRFPDLRTAMTYWKRTSNVVPLRPDGRPNRPLTAYSVEVVDLPPETSARQN